MDASFYNTEKYHIHERALRIAYSDYNSSFYELLDKDDTFTIYQKKCPKFSN